MIRAIGLVIILCIAVGISSGQEKTEGSRPCDAEKAKEFDFWLGEWDLTWPAEQFGGEQGDVFRGSNSVTKIMDNCIIQEEFRFPGQNFNGHSVTAYNAKDKIWQQTWVDNQGSYLLFTGQFKDDKMELRSATWEKDGKKYMSRMVFKNISNNSLDWDWQRSSDGGKTWKNLWNIHYERKKSGTTLTNN